MDASIDVLLCKSGERMCALPIEHVVETMRPLPTESIANQPAFVRGLAMIRGRPTPVVDAALLLGDSAPAAHQPAHAKRFVTLRLGERERERDRQIAIALDEVIGLRSVARSSFEKLPAFVGANVATSGVGRIDRSLVTLLGAARVVPESVWSAIENEKQAAPA